MHDRKRSWVWLASCMLMLALLASPAWGTVIVGNGGFETAGVGGATNSDMWTEFTSAANNLSERSTANPEFGLYSHHLYAEGLDMLGTVAGVQQNSGNDVGLPSLQPGSTLTATFDAMTPFGPGGVMNYTLRILNGAGGIVDIFNGGTGAPSATYNTYSTPALTVPAFGAAPNDYYVAFFEVNAAAGGFVGSISEVYIDNVVIEGTLVPEPATISLLALGAFCLRRRSR